MRAIPRFVPAQRIFFRSTCNPKISVPLRYKSRCSPLIRRIPIDVEAQMLPSGPAASESILSLTNPSRRVSVVTFSSRKRFKPFCVPTHMLCSRSSRKHHTRAADNPSNCEYFSIFIPWREPACSRTSPCPTVPIHVFPLLSRSTVLTSRVFLSMSGRLKICPSLTGRVNPSGRVSQMSPFVSSLSQNFPFAISRGGPWGLPGSRRRTRLSVVNQIKPLLSWSGPDKKVSGSVIAVPTCP